MLIHLHIHQFQEELSNLVSFDTSLQILNTPSKCGVLICPCSAFLHLWLRNNHQTGTGHAFNKYSSLINVFEAFVDILNCPIFSLFYLVGNIHMFASRSPNVWCQQCRVECRISLYIYYHNIKSIRRIPTSCSI